MKMEMVVQVHRVTRIQQGLVHVLSKMMKVTIRIVLRKT